MAKIILTRPGEQGEEFAAKLVARRIPKSQIILAPIVEIVDLPITDSDVGDAVILTSRNAVARLTVTPPPSHPAYVVGAQTAKDATAKGFLPVVTAETMDALLRHLKTMKSPRRFAFYHGEPQTEDLSVALRETPHSVSSYALYRQSAKKFDCATLGLMKSARMIFPVFSKNAAHILCDNLEGHAGDWHFLAISSLVGEVLTSRGHHHCHISKKPDGASMVEGIYDLMREYDRISPAPSERF